MSRKTFCIAVAIVFLTHPLEAQYFNSQFPLNMNRNAIGLTLWSLGNAGKVDNGRKMDYLSFSYPLANNTSIYAGGWERVAWNSKPASAGEEFWVMSKTGGQIRVSVVSGQQNQGSSNDIDAIDQPVETYPEAYIGLTDHRESALNVHRPVGVPHPEERFTINGYSLISYWPASGGVSRAPDTVSTGWYGRAPVIMMNHRFNHYNSGQALGERIAAGDFQRLQAPARVEQVSEDEFPDMIGIVRGYSKTQPLEWTRRWFSWGHDDYNDFYLVENVVENTGTERAEGVYFVLRNRFFSGMASTWYEGGSDWGEIKNRKASDNYVRSTLAKNYLDGGAPLGSVKPAGLSVGKDLAECGYPIVYLHDGDSEDIDFAHNDWGDPWIPGLAAARLRTTQLWVKDGMLQHSVYFGLGLVDAFAPFNTYGGVDPDMYVMPHDNPDTPVDESVQQPASIAFYNLINHQSLGYPNLKTHPPEQIYDTMSTAGYMDEPDFPEEWAQFMIFGPYNLNPGEKCKAVVAYVGGMGSQQPKYSDYKRYARPFDFAWMNMYDGPGQTANFRERQQELPAGEEAMFRHFQRAIDVYNWGYDIPNQPPNIKLATRFNEDGQTVVSWSVFGENSPDPDYSGTEAQDLRGYRIYSSQTENQGPYELVGEFSFDDARTGRLPTGVRFDPNAVWHSSRNVPIKENVLYAGSDPESGAEVPGLYEFLDSGSRVAFPSWYAVRYYDSGHSDWKGLGAVPVLESSSGPDGSGSTIGGYDGIIPVLLLNSVFDRLEARVKVVPNPFKLNDDLHTYKGSLSIRFINLPQRAQLEIYDVTGQRVWKDFNADSGQAEVSWEQKTFGQNPGQGVFPGIYFWKVTSLMPQSMGKVQTGTFVIIK